MSEIDWSKAPEGATHYTPRSPDVCWFRHDGEGWRSWIDGRWGVAYGSEGFFESLIPRPTQWRGPEDGLPPVGTVCEALRRGEWVKCTIVAHVQSDGVTEAIYQCASDWDWSSTSFRPLKSDKDRAVDAALKVMPHPGAPSTLADIELLYDAGLLRLPEAQS